jgi:pimeloyl-ACP methyl ester carboxylesterase
MTRRRPWTLLTVVVLLAGCSSDGRPAEDAARPSDRDRSTTTTTGDDGAAEIAPAAWEDCGAGLECATVEVPLDYDQPDRARIGIGLARVPADDPDERIGSLLVNPGGPGGSGVEFVEAFRFSRDIHDRFDVVGFDPRGVGESRGLTCGGEIVDEFFALDPDPDDPVEQADLEGMAGAIAADCEAEDGDVLAHIGTDDVVRDIDSIRRALGEDQISFYGFSYGTLLGARYAEQYPESTRAIVLDGVVDPAHDFEEWLTEQTTGFERAIADVFAECEHHIGCPEIGAEAAYDQLLATVEVNPLPAGPGVTLGPGDLATAVIFVTYDPSSWPDLYDALSAGLAGDGAPLMALADSYRAFGEFTQYAAVVCVDSPHPTGATEFRRFAAELETISPRFGPAIANELLSCAYWPAAAVGDPRPVTAAGAPPILVIGNTGDAATPYEQAVRVADGLESGVLLTHEGEGHTSYGASPCVDDAVAEYLIELDVPPENTICR